MHDLQSGRRGSYLPRGSCRSSRSPIACTSHQSPAASEVGYGYRDKLFSNASSLYDNELSEGEESLANLNNFHLVRSGSKGNSNDWHSMKTNSPSAVQHSQIRTNKNTELYVSSGLIRPDDALSSHCEQAARSIPRDSLSFGGSYREGLNSCISPLKNQSASSCLQQDQLLARPRNPGQNEELPPIPRRKYSPPTASIEQCDRLTWEEEARNVSMDSIYDDQKIRDFDKNRHYHHPGRKKQESSMNGNYVPRFVTANGVSLDEVFKKQVRIETERSQSLLPTSGYHRGSRELDSNFVTGPWTNSSHRCYRGNSFKDNRRFGGFKPYRNNRYRNYTRSYFQGDGGYGRPSRFETRAPFGENSGFSWFDSSDKSQARFIDSNVHGCKRPSTPYTAYFANWDVDSQTRNDGPNFTQDELKEYYYRRGKMDYVSMMNKLCQRNAKKVTDSEYSDPIRGRLNGYGNRYRILQRFTLATRTPDGNINKRFVVVGEGADRKRAKQDAAVRMYIKLIIGEKLVLSDDDGKKKDAREESKHSENKNAKMALEELASAGLIVAKPSYDCRNVRLDPNAELNNPNHSIMLWNATCTVVLVSPEGITICEQGSWLGKLTQRKLQLRKLSKSSSRTITLRR